MENTITLPISKKIVILKSVMSTKEVREARTEAGGLLQVMSSVQGREPTQEEVAIVINKTNRQDEIVAEALLKRTNLTQADLDELPYTDGLFAYNKLYESTVITPKN